ncbi:MAG: Zn-dependent alcohol dehydrogenase [Mycobacteriales bacterium]
MKAAVLHQAGDTVLDIRDDVATVDPGPGEVLVAIRATGVCHSDLSAMNGSLPQMFPAVLGHEGSGEVLAVGSAVDDLAAGDHVIVCWVPTCGACRYCVGGQPNLCTVYTMKSFVEPKFTVGGAPAFGMAGTGTFAEQLVLPRSGVVRIEPDVPFDVAALIGCGVMTGVGAVINTAQVPPGSSVAVIGCGGVGISVIQGARLAGAAQIVAVDPVEDKRSWARSFGATHVATPEELPGVMASLTGDGFDYAFEAVGRAATIRAAYDVTRRGGTTVVVGAGRADEKVELSPFELLFMERRILGSVYGGAHVRRDYPRLIALWRAGRLDLSGMISRRLTLDQVNEGLEAMVAGEVIRQVIEFA